LFVREFGGPAVGFGDGGVEVVVDLAEYGDESLLVDSLVVSTLVVPRQTTITF
jgi:hypothetical protein